MLLGCVQYLRGCRGDTCPKAASKVGSDNRKLQSQTESSCSYRKCTGLNANLNTNTNLNHLGVFSCFDVCSARARGQSRSLARPRSLILARSLAPSPRRPRRTSRRRRRVNLRSSQARRPPQNPRVSSSLSSPCSPSNHSSNQSNNSVQLLLEVSLRACRPPRQDRREGWWGRLGWEGRRRRQLLREGRPRVKRPKA